LVPPGQIVISIILLCAVYSLLFGVWLFVLRRKLLKGPDDVTPATPAAPSVPAAEVTP
jgi:cytochrome bd-type quinol oxidase subunit 1